MRERRFGHIPGLDGVRGVAVLLVVLFHFGKLWRSDVGGLLPAGYIGVDIFFVLSGFLITSLLLTERATSGVVSLKRFYIRRGLRLLPALVGVLVAHAIYTRTQHLSMTEEIKQIASVLAYVSNFAQTYWLPSMLASGLSFTWSLAIEEQFYLVWPAVLLFAVLRYCKTQASILVVVFGLALLSALARAVIWKYGSGYPAAYMLPIARADGLLIGAGGAFLWRWQWVPTKWLNEVALVAFLGLIGTALVVPRQSTVMFWGGFSVVSLAAAVVVLATAENAWIGTRWMEARWLRALGQVSYGLYLWHVLSLRIASTIFDGSGRVFVAVAGLVIAAATTTASWFLIEQPFLRMKARWAGSASLRVERPLRARSRSQSPSA